MDIFAIVEQPNPVGPYVVVQAAYRQNFFHVISDSAPDPDLPMYADLYFGYVSGVTYYKTITSYDMLRAGGVGPLGEYLFDIQDALQEYIATYIPRIPVGTAQITDGTDPYSVTTVYVYFRGSSIVGGLLVPNGPVPVQGTMTTPPIAGGGWPSNGYFAYNSSILPQYADITVNQMELSFLTFQTGQFIIPADARIYSMSTLPNQPTLLPPTPITALNTYRDDCGGFPIIILQWGTPAGWAGPPLSPTFRNARVGLWYSVPSGSPAGSLGSSGILYLTASALLGTDTYLLPLGGKEIETALGTPTMKQLVDPANNYYYRIFLGDLDANCFQWFSPWYKFKTTTLEKTRICFQSTYGQFEWVSFGRYEEEFKTTSNEQFTPYVQKFDLPATYTLTLGHQRNNVRANDEITITGMFPEQIMPWLKQLFASPLVFIQANRNTNEWKEQPDSTIPALKEIKILDGTFTTRKSVLNGRLFYEVSFKAVPSIDYIVQRN